MAFTPGRIHVGPARIFVGVTNPASGGPPTFVTHTAGVPATGTEIGLTEGDTVFTYNPKKTKVMSEQYYAATDVYLTEEECHVTFTAQESTVKALQAAFDNIGQFSDGTKDAFFMGSGSGAFSCLKQSVMVTARQRINTTKYIVILMYLAVTNKPLVYPFSRTKKATWPVQLDALADTTRSSGDAIAQFYYEL